MSEFRDLPPSSSSNERVTTPTPQQVGSLLAAETDSAKLQNHFNLLRDTMTPAEAAQALALGVRGGKAAEILPYNMDPALDAVAAAFGRARSAVSPEGTYTPSETDKQQIADLFAAVRENLDWMGSTDNRRGVLSAGLHGLLNQNPELAGSAVPLVGSLLAAETDSAKLQNHFNILRDTMAPAEAAQALALGVRGGQAAETLSYNMDSAFDAVAAAFGRARSAVSPETAYAPTEADRQQITDLFAAVRENLDWMGSTDNRRGVLSAGLHGLLNQNPELKDLGKQLLQEVDRGVPERLIHQISYIAPQTPVAEVQRMIDRGTAREVATGIERFRFINRVLAKLPDDRRQVVQDRLNLAFANSPDTARRAGILGALFETTESQQLIRQLNRVGAALENIPEIFADDAVVEIISVMADHPAEYRFQLGALLTQIPVNQLPNSIGEKLKPIITDTELKLKSEHGTWWLCGQAEPRLRHALADGAVMLVNGRLLLKFHGKLSALCLESFTTSGGTVFLEGNWYSPTDGATRVQLRNQFDQGHAKVQLTTGEWAIMRPLDKEENRTPEQILEGARQAAQQLPDRLPDQMAGLDRRRYREARKEED